MVFTNWDARKRAFGVTGPTSAMSEAERADFFRQLFLADVNQGNEASVDEASQFERWGFSAIDLAWEAQIRPVGAEGTTILFSFDDGFDVASLAERFEACNFDTSGSGAQVVYTTDINNECLTATGPVPVPTLPTNATAAGLVPARHLLVMSFDPKHVRSELHELATGAATLDQNPSASLLADTLSADDAAGLLFGTGTCESLDLVRTPTPENLQKLEEARREFGGRPYVVLALGQQQVAEPHDGTIAFLYLDPADAKADLAVRMRADEAPSIAHSAPYSEFDFQVDDAQVNGPVVDLSVSQPEGATSDLLDLYGQADLLFALCQ